MMNKVKRTFVYLAICMLIGGFLLPVSVSAEPQAEFDMQGGFGIEFTVTNTGDEPLFGFLEVEVSRQGSVVEGNLPGMKEPLEPGESLTWNWRPAFLPFFLQPIHKALTPICQCTIHVWSMENGGDHTIFGEKTVDALYIFGFVILQ